MSSLLGPFADMGLMNPKLTLTLDGTSMQKLAAEGKITVQGACESLFMCLIEKVGEGY